MQWLDIHLEQNYLYLEGRSNCIYLLGAKSPWPDLEDGSGSGQYFLVKEHLVYAEIWWLH